MKTLKTLFIALLLVAMAPVSAQDNVDEIIDAYFENTGGAEAWANLEGVKMTATTSAQGMDIPLVIYQLRDGRQFIKYQFQGQEIVAQSFDGETAWATNFMTMQAEKSDAEMTENIKKASVKSFPSPLFDYKKKGFTAELIGDETIDGTETFKVKLTMDPITIDGVEESNVVFYFFEKEYLVPIATEVEIKMGPAKGQMVQGPMSDYQEVDGLMFQFSTSMQGQSITINDIELNPEIDEAMFAFPEE